MSYPVSAGKISMCIHRYLSPAFKGVLAAVLLFTAAGLHAQSSLAERERSYEKQILESASDHGVDPYLIKAIIFTESTFFPNKVGNDGEIGLMQIRRAVAEDWAKFKGIPTPSREDMFDPDLNIEIGTWYISRALKRWYSNPDFLRLALAEYNAGRKRLLQWLALYDDDTDKLLSSKPIGKYADRVCRKYVEYVVGNVNWDIPDEIQPQIALNR